MGRAVITKAIHACSGTLAQADANLRSQKRIAGNKAFTAYTVSAFRLVVPYDANVFWDDLQKSIRERSNSYNTL